MPRTVASPRKAAIVGEALVNGVRPTARRHHIAPSTLQRWRDDPTMAQLRAEKREDVAADVWAAFQAGVRRVLELIPQTDDLQKVATATGIIYDKYALISGQATSRSETTSITEGLSENRKRELRDYLDTLPSDPVEA